MCIRGGSRIGSKVRIWDIGGAAGCGTVRHVPETEKKRDSQTTLFTYIKHTLRSVPSEFVQRQHIRNEKSPPKTDLFVRIMLEHLRTIAGNGSIALSACHQFSINSKQVTSSRALNEEGSRSTVGKETLISISSHSRPFTLTVSCAFIYHVVVAGIIDGSVLSRDPGFLWTLGGMEMTSCSGQLSRGAARGRVLVFHNTQLLV